jgi:hypothetical protein
MTLKGHTDTITCLDSKDELLFSGSLDCVIRSRIFMRIHLSRMGLENWAMYIYFCWT